MPGEVSSAASRACAVRGGASSVSEAESGRVDVAPAVVHNAEGTRDGNVLRVPLAGGWPLRAQTARDAHGRLQRAGVELLDDIGAYRLDAECASAGVHGNVSVWFAVLLEPSVGGC